MWTKSTKDQNVCIQIKTDFSNLFLHVFLNQSKTMKRERTGGSKRGTAKKKTADQSKSVNWLTGREVYLQHQRQS